MRQTILVVLILANGFVQAQADSSIIQSYLTVLTKTEEFRNQENIAQLNKTAAFIQSVFEQYADSVSVQEFKVNGRIFKNVIGSFGTTQAKRIIVGAHYDVCGRQEGADDNASGVVGLLELARLLKGQKLSYRIDLVAYSLEEPPFFRTKNMGSYVHAKSLFEQKVAVYGMISVEMIGYFKDEKKTQSYPVGILSLIYGNKGNYITLVKKMKAGKFARQFCSDFKATKAIKTKVFAGPAALPGIDFSDHLNYWSFGYSALMITDTSFYRNKNYHEPTDTIETLDLSRMAKVINGIFRTLIFI
jgi:Peptidase family M28